MAMQEFLEVRIEPSLGSSPPGGQSEARVSRGGPPRDQFFLARCWWAFSIS